MKINKYISFYNPFKTFIEGVKYRVTDETTNTYMSQGIEVPKSQEYITYETGDINTRVDTTA
ncbi:MAG: hypothetical protein RSF40_01225 [Oscillospiraceae bacterium]